MHEGVEALIQKFAANTSTLITDKHKDLALNFAQEAFVLKRVNELQQIQSESNITTARSIEDIRTLIVRNHKLNVLYADPSNPNDGFMYDENMYYGNLPANHGLLLNCRVRSAYKKNENGQSNCTNVNTTILADDVNLQEYIAIVPFVLNADIGGCDNNSLTFKIVFKNAATSTGTTTNLNVFDFDAFTAAAGFKKDINFVDDVSKYPLVELVLEYLNRFNSAAELVNFDSPSPANPNPVPYVHPRIEFDNDSPFFNVYWETYRNQYYQNCFIFVSKQKTDVTDRTNPVVTTFESDSTYNDNNKGLSVEIYVNNVTNTPTFSGRFQQVTYYRKVPNGVCNEIQWTPTTPNVNTTPTFNVIQRGTDMLLPTFMFGSVARKPTVERPIGTISKNYLQIYSDGTFVPFKLIIDYVKKPSMISLKYNLNCRLPEHTHQEIVSIAAKLLMAATNPNNYEVMAVETKQRLR